MDAFTNLLLKLPIFGGEQKKLSKLKLYAIRGLCLLLVVALIGCAAYSLVPERTVLTSDTYTSSLGVDANYRVNLSDNRFFQSDVLDMDENYIRSLVNTIDISFDFDCQQSGNGETVVRYSAVGTISAWYRDGNENLMIWSQDELLIDTSTTDLSSSDCSFSVPVTVDPSVYSKMIVQFQNDMEINVNAYYDVMLTANVTYLQDGKGSSDTLYSYVSIPLTGQVFKVTAQDPSRRAEKTYSLSTVLESEPSIMQFVIFLILALLAVFAFVVSMLCLTEKKPDLYKQRLNSMIASVEDRIAYVQGMQTCRTGDIRIADFDSIIRLADERALPVFCVRDDLERTAVFFVTENNQKFYYGITEEMVLAELAGEADKQPESKEAAETEPAEQSEQQEKVAAVSEQPTEKADEQSADEKGNSDDRCVVVQKRNKK